MTKVQKSDSSHHNFDSEATGLVLLALSIFLLGTLLLPHNGIGFMSMLRHVLFLWLAWSSYTLPLALLLYVLLIFMRHSLWGLTRRMLGGVLVILALLALQQVFWPGTAGQLVALVLSPLRPLSYLVALLPLVLLTLGLEVVLNMGPFIMLRVFFRMLGHLLSKSVAASQEAAENRKEGSRIARQRKELKQHYHAHIHDLNLLMKLHPDSAELSQWYQAARTTHKDLRKLNEDQMQALTPELLHAQSLRQNFEIAAAHSLTQDLVHEALPEGLQAEQLLGRIQAQQHELGVPLPATQVCAALDRVRQQLVMELQRLCTHLGQLERDRQGAIAKLQEVDAATLTHETAAHEQRQQQWEEAAQAFYSWQERAQHYQGWPALASAFDAGPAPLAQEAAKALLGSVGGPLPDRVGWTAYAEAGGAIESGTTPSYNPETPEAQFGARLSHQPHLLSGLTSVPATPAPAVSAPTISAPASPSPAPEAVDHLPAPSGRKLAPDTLPWEGEDAPKVTRRSKPKQGALELALPNEQLLDPIPRLAHNTAQLDVAARQRAALINDTLAQFGLSARVTDFARGPTVTRYEIEPAPGEKISRISSLSNDLARALAVGGVRIEAPVPGKSVIGLEVPNAEREPVTFHTAIAAPTWKQSRAKLPIVLGKSIDGELMVGDLAKMPHLLVAGSTGSGKSVCVNTLITSLLYRYLPTELRFLMIDPKMVELTPYDGIPHLVRGVVTNPMDAAGVLLGAVAHMERRYKMMSQAGAKNLEQFNAKMRQIGEPELPHLIIIIDELADLMITSPKEVESAIMRLAQMARATGMHLILATQRPSVDILTSLIKVNIPARIAFAVSSSHDSRTILDSMGAERLTGMGDMLFYQPGLIKPVRLQGPYISEAESARITEELRRQVFDDHFVELYGPDFDGAIESGSSSASSANMDFSDPYLRQAAEICIEEGQGSVSRLQRRLSVGHSRAGKLIDMLEAMGIVSKHQGSKPREVLITRDDLPDYFGK